MTYRTIDVSQDGPVVHVALNRPDVRNAFNEDLVAELTAWAHQARTSDVRAVVMSGRGPAFCAGADLAWMARTAHYERDDNVRDAAAAARMFEAVDDLPVPVIARVHGAALGGGAGLCAVCDVVVADEHTVFGFTEVKLGLIPAVISPYVLRKIGHSAARHLFVTGARFSAMHALEIGLVHAVVTGGDLDERVSQYVREVQSSGPEAVAAVKVLLRGVAGQPREVATGVATEALAERRGSDEGREGVQAFLEKRRPGWTVAR